MMKRFTLILAILSGGYLSAQEPVTEEAQWLEALGANDFEKRDQGSNQLWAAGDRALKFLDDLKGGDDPELASRAESLALKIRSGITPETSETIIEQINRFFAPNSTKRTKAAILEELRRLEEYGYIFRLRNLSTDEDVVEKADQIIEDVLPDLVKNLTSKGEFEEVKKLLLMGKDLSSMMAYANVVQNLGELDEIIARLRKSEIAEDQARYLACLRVKGDAALLRFEAQRLGDVRTEAIAALAMGEHLPLFQLLHASEDLNLSDRHYLQWSISMAKREFKKADEIKNALFHLCRDESERGSARMNLTRMGFGEEVSKDFRPNEIKEILDFQLGQENYLEVLPALGLADGKLTEAWLKKTARMLKSDLAGEDDSTGALRFFYIADFLERRGLVEEATRCYMTLFDVLRSQEEQSLSAWISAAFQFGPRATIKVLANEVVEHDYDVNLAIEDLYGTEANHAWLFQTLEDLYPASKIEDLLLLMVSFAMPANDSSGNHLYVPEEEFEAARAKVIAHILDSGDRVGGLSKLLGFDLARDREPDLVEIYDLLEKEGSKQSDLRLALFEIRRMHFQEAGRLFEKVEINEQSATPFLMYQKGLALRKANLPGGEALIRKALLSSQGSSYDLYNFGLLEKQFGFAAEAEELFQSALLRISLLDDSSRTSYLGGILSQLIVTTTAKKNWNRLIAFREVVAWETNSERMIFGSRARFQILLARGASAMRDGDLVAASDLLTQAHAQIPRDGFLANDFFPLVRELGLVELHDQLFAESARYCREVIQLYPGDDNALNNFAWMASRANRCLDEAEGYLKIALELNPRSSAYLDTMGEIYFARRNREEAVRWSNLSLLNEMSDVELQGQNRRFIQGGFPIR